jgi:hypothetical protein
MLLPSPLRIQFSLWSCTGIASQKLLEALMEETLSDCGAIRSEANVARRDGENFDYAPWLHKAKETPKEGFKSKVERHLTGKETEPWETIYFKLYKSQLPVAEKAVETAALMLGSDKSWVVAWRCSARIFSPERTFLNDKSLEKRCTKLRQERPRLKLRIEEYKGAPPSNART